MLLERDSNRTRSSGTYELSLADVRELTNDLERRYANPIAIAQAQREQRVCIAVDGHDPLSDIGRQLEQRIFNAEAGDHRPEVMRSEYGVYEDRSLFFLVYDTEAAEVTGVLRAVTGTAGFGPPVKSIRDSLHTEGYQAEFIDLTTDSTSYANPEVGIIGEHSNTSLLLDRKFVESYHGMRSGEGIFDIATIAVEKSARRQSMATAHFLIAAAYRATHILGIHHAVTFVRSDLLEYLREGLDMRWRDLAGLGATQYVDGDPFLSQPAYVSFHDFRRVVEANRHDVLLGRPLKMGPSYSSFLEFATSADVDHLFVL